MSGQAELALSAGNTRLNIDPVTYFDFLYLGTNTYYGTSTLVPETDLLVRIFRWDNRTTWILWKAHW